jgi:hypothetical protein
MEQSVSMKSPCVFVDLDVFVHHKATLLEEAVEKCAALRAKCGFHRCTAVLSNDALFDEVCNTYWRCMRDPTALSFAFSIVCGKYRANDRRSCFQYSLQFSLLSAMKEFVRASLDSVPWEVRLEDIYARLDVMSKRAWRVADPRIHRATELPQYSYPWRTGAFGEEKKYTTRFFHLCQLAFDDELVRFTKWRRQSTDLYSIRDREYVQAAAMGGSVRVFKFLVAHNPISDKSDAYRCAAAMGQFEFLKTVEPTLVTRTNVLQWLWNIQTGVYESRKFGCARPWFPKHPVIYWVRDRHYDWVDQFMSMPDPHFRVFDFNTPSIFRDVLRACALYGYLPPVSQYEQYAGLSTTVRDILMHGTSSIVLRWLRAMRADLFTETTRFRHWALEGGVPEIFAWLFEEKFLTWKEDSAKLFAEARLRGHKNLLAWLDKVEEERHYH